MNGLKEVQACGLFDLYMPDNIQSMDKYDIWNDDG